MITRTIKTYEHTFGVYNEETGCMDDLRINITTKSCGPRVLAKMAKELGSGYVHLKTDEITKNYSMPIEEFIQHAEEF